MWALIAAILGRGVSGVMSHCSSNLARARPSGYFTMALGISLPFNIPLCIPLYHAMVSVLRVGL
jgi:hypothetical protein